MRLLASSFRFVVSVLAVALLLAASPPPVRGQAVDVDTTTVLSGSSFGNNAILGIDGVADDGSGSERLFVSTKDGRIWVVSFDSVTGDANSPSVFLDISGHVDSGRNERGLLGIALHPSYTTNGHLYVSYSCEPSSPDCTGRGNSIFRRFTRSSTDPNVADATSGLTLGTVRQPRANHNGGCIRFGPDGYLYIGMGDGGGSNDNAGQNANNPSSLLGKMLRVDVDNLDPATSQWTVPPDNPFGDEIWSSGLRNPWRFSFDRETGDLWIADVGQSAREEVNFVPAANNGAGGIDFGWCGCEGTRDNDNTVACQNSIPNGGCVDPIPSRNYVPPAFEYGRGTGISVTGGYVYRGSAYKQRLDGIYFYGDFISTELWGARPDGSGGWTNSSVDNDIINFVGTVSNPVTFGEDHDGELYVGTNGGDLLRIRAVGAPPPPPPPAPPGVLSVSFACVNPTSCSSERLRCCSGYRCQQGTCML